MKKDKAIGNYWMLAAMVLAVAVVTFVFSRPGYFSCFWRNEDPDFCYSVAALRFLDGIPSGFVEHPGYSLTQLLGWFYKAAEQVGILSEASFLSFAADPDPLLRIGEYVSTGWLFSSLVYLLIVWMVFHFARLLTGSNAMGFVAATLALFSWSNVQFLLTLRPEALSALFAIGSLFFMFKAVHAERFRIFATYCVVSSTLAFFSLLAKLNALPLLFFLPLVSLLKLDTPMDRLSSRSTKIALVHAFAVNLLMAPLTIEVMKTWVFVTIGEYMLSKVFYPLLFLAVFAIGYVRLWMRGGIYAGALRGRALLQSAVCLLLFSLGYQLAAGLSLVRPRLNIYFIAVSVICLTAGLLTKLAVNWAHNGSPGPSRNRRVKVLFMTAVCLILLSTGYQLGAELSLVRSWPNSHLIAVVATLLAITLLVAAAMGWGPVVHLWSHHSPPERASRPAPAVYMIVFAVVWGIFWTLAMVGPKFNLHVGRTPTAGDVSLALFRLGNLDLNTMYLYKPVPDLLADFPALTRTVVLPVVGHYRAFRWPLLIGASVMLLFFREKHRHDTRLVLFFMMVGFAFSLFSAMKGVFLQRYIIYEELATILGVSVCLGCFARHIRSKATETRFGYSSGILALSAIVIFAVPIVAGLQKLGQIHDGLGCGSLQDPSNTDACICNTYYAQNTGMMPLVEQHYGAPCQGAVNVRVDQGLAQEWRWWQIGDLGP